MENEELDVFVIKEDGKKYIIDVKKAITYSELMETIKERITRHKHFYVIFNGKEYTKNNKYDILNFNQSDKIYLFLTAIDFCYACLYNLNLKLDKSDTKVLPLSGILQLCLLKYIAKNMNDNEINKIASNEIRNIILDLQKEMDLNDDPQKDIFTNLNQKVGKNIITYINYIEHIATEKEISNLISLCNQNKKNQINEYWSQMSKYEQLNQLFQKDFKKAIENSYFDYSLIGVSIYKQERKKKIHF